INKCGDQGANTRSPALPLTEELGAGLRWQTSVNYNSILMTRDGLFHAFGILKDDLDISVHKPGRTYYYCRPLIVRTHHVSILNAVLLGLAFEKPACHTVYFGKVDL